MTNHADVVRGHARIHETAAALFRALDAVDTANISARAASFIDAVDAHVRIDATLGLDGHEAIASHFESFRGRWRSAPPNDLLRSPFRDELETIVSTLLRRMRAELRLFDVRSGVA